MTKYINLCMPKFYKKLKNKTNLKKQPKKNIQRNKHKKQLK